MTKSLEDYLEEIHVLILQKGRARVRDVAQDLHVKMPSVVKAITELKKLELVNQEPYGDIELTPKGRKLAAADGILVPMQAEYYALEVEHILSATTLDRIREFVEGAPNKVSAKKKETK